MKIKKLEWKNINKSFSNAKTPFGYYLIDKRFGYLFVGFKGQEERFGINSSLVNLKQKAQEHFESIIKDCIE